MADGPTRRRLLVACGACLAPLGAGCGESGSPTATLTPASVPPTAVVAVGPDGELAFRPGTDEPLRVPTGATVQFVWRGNNHNIRVTDRPPAASWDGTPGPETRTFDAGYVHEHTFDVPGRYRYECFAHKPAGHGEVHVFDGRVREGATLSPSPTPGVQSGTAVVDVGPGGELVFRPGVDPPLRITPGTTVRFVWGSDNHNVRVLQQPEGASWRGSAGPKTETYDEGHVHEHTFEVPGRYEYECVPHGPSMRGAVEVVEA